MDQRLLFLLVRAARLASAHASARLLDRAEVSLPQLATLSYLAESPGCMMSDVAVLLDLNRSAMSGMVQRIERSGFVRRVPSNDDARAVRLHLTSEGQAARRRAGPAFRALLAELTEGFDERELDVVLRFLNAVVERCGSESASAEVDS